MTSLKIAIAAALAFGALFAGSSQVQQQAAPVHVASTVMSPNVGEICCGG